MGATGRLLIDAAGLILSADRAFCRTVGIEAEEAVGRNVLDFTAPADHDGCIRVMERMLAGSPPVVTVKRIVKPDATHLWVESRLSRLAEDGVFEIAMQEAPQPAEWIAPGDLLHMARTLFNSRRGRTEVFEADLFPDHAWDILIAAYISESEGRVLTTAGLHADIGISLGNASRWLRALSSLGLVEYEDAGMSTLVTAPFRLSGVGHARFERYLASQIRAFDQRIPMTPA